MAWVTRWARIAALLWLGGCSAANFDIPGAGENEALYARLYPYYAEYCALSQIKKKRGFGADIRGEVGGHAVFYLNGACLDRSAHYPVLQLCEAGPSGDASGGVGLSMNEHFRNAKWVATPGRDFFFHGTFPGGLQPGDTLTQAAYAGVRAHAQALGVYDGVEFYPRVFRDAPPDMPRETWKYEVSIATDYGIGLGRGRYCVRVPSSRAQMAAMIGFLNDQNAPYRRGEQDFHWSVFRDNCIHLAHNALAAVGLWREWRINRFILVAVFDFPVPKNEFVNLARRVNDTPIDDPAALWADAASRRGLMQFDRLPVEPGSIVESVPPHRPNEVYDTDLALVFYDEPMLGPYQGWFDRLFRDPRYVDLRSNLQHAAALYRTIAATQRPLAWWLDQRQLAGAADRQDFAAFYDHYYAHITQQAARTAADLARLAVPDPAGPVTGPITGPVARPGTGPAARRE